VRSNLLRGVERGLRWTMVVREDVDPSSCLFGDEYPAHAGRLTYRLRLLKWRQM
jgi:hypothetical protein